jgi:uncharacterized membrane protein (Fun14 family)
MADPSAPPAASNEPGFRAWLASLPRWKKVTLVAAVGIVVVAGAVSLATTGSLGSSGGTAPAPAGSGGTMLGPSSSLVNGSGGSGTAGGAAPVAEPASKGVFRLGFSFLAGFCIGAFVRAALKVAAIAFGFWLLATMALSYFDVLTVDWTAISSLWDRFAANVEREWGSFQTFVTGSLPAAGLAVTGLALGLKRK